VSLPPSTSDIAFEQFLQELPENYDQLAREFKAFCRPRKIKTPAQMRLDGPRQATWWRVWKLIKQEVAIMISGVRQWNFERWEQCLAVMQERPRRRTLQTLPDRVNRLIASCQLAGLSNI
jgi:hypothetical protein